MIDAPILFSAPMIRAIQREIERPGTGKTQTRRILTPHNTLFDGRGWTKIHREQTWDCSSAWVDPGPSPAGNPGPYLKLPWLAGPDRDGFEGTVHRIYPRHQPGLRLWVREDCQAAERTDGADVVRYPAGGPDVPISDSREAAERWLDLLHYRRRRGLVRRSIHMPRWASRFTLAVTEVRIQRLHDITPDDAVAEGIDIYGPAVAVYRKHRHTHPEALRRYDAVRLRKFVDLWVSINGPEAWRANPWVIATTFIPFPCNVDQLPEARHAAA